MTVVDPVSDSSPGDGVPRAEVPDPVRRRLAPPMPTDKARSWWITIGVAAIATILRFVGLAHPKGKIFDEVYYAKDAHDLIGHAVEWDAKTNSGSYVVHPPLGKWLIGLGEWIFGYNEFGWRIAALVAGVASIVIVIRLARRMFRSTLLGAAAGLLMTLDGMHFVSSRVALLDIFLLLFVLAAFACLVIDREVSRRRWLRALEGGLDPATSRPRRTRAEWPWWRFAAAACTGLALGVKWSAVWYLIAFVVLIVVWEAGARRAAGVPHWWRDTVLDELGWIAVFVGLTMLTYLATWTGWLATDQGWDRHWLRDRGDSEPPVIGSLINLVQYHRDILKFHTNLDSPHAYRSWPWQWLLLGRPVAYYYSGDGPCGSSQCAAEVILLGTPVLWWSFIPALFGTAWQAIARRDWRAWAILAGAAMGIVPWFAFGHRTMFYFYALPSEPFLVLAVTLVLGMIIGDRLASYERRLVGAMAAGVYLAIVALCFAYFYPLYVGDRMPYADWYARMWLGGRWI